MILVYFFFLVGGRIGGLFQNRLLELVKRKVLKKILFYGFIIGIIVKKTNKKIEFKINKIYKKGESEKQV